MLVFTLSISKIKYFLFLYVYLHAIFYLFSYTYLNTINLYTTKFVAWAMIVTITFAKYTFILRFLLINS